ncbi:hypothetical protein Q428_09715 [Fervidicella metallireducens AeB]|uniref:Uncharacterized protein n=1 Tax=Fervidicella metallireducens AeB TaxID=1403537 RepID=A0A017RW22_9CLOT|nr:hypothetical protein Q428_09715 [Fervidicella metallireducens AeB]
MLFGIRKLIFEIEYFAYSIYNIEIYGAEDDLIS